VNQEQRLVGPDIQGRINKMHGTARVQQGTMRNTYRQATGGDGWGRERRTAGDAVIDNLHVTLMQMTKPFHLCTLHSRKPSPKHHLATVLHDSACSIC
jgi:hypothetical protein